MVSCVWVGIVRGAIPGCVVPFVVKVGPRFALEPTAVSPCVGFDRFMKSSPPEIPVGNVRSRVACCGCVGYEASPRGWRVFVLFWVVVLYEVCPGVCAREVSGVVAGFRAVPVAFVVWRPWCLGSVLLVCGSGGPVCLWVVIPWVWLFISPRPAARRSFPHP